MIDDMNLLIKFVFFSPETIYEENFLKNKDFVISITLIVQYTLPSLHLYAFLSFLEDH